MVVYWDLVALWNFALDYLLLLGTLRLAGRPIRRVRLAAASALGAGYSVAALLLPFSPWSLAGAMLLMCVTAFGRSRALVRLTLLFTLLACALGGGVLLLGRAGGGMERLAAGMLYARLPWGVFLAAAGASYLLLTLVFRGGARRRGGGFVRARVEYGGKSVELRLFRDSGNTLTDPLTGEGVPVLSREAMAPLISGEMPLALHCRTVEGADAALGAFRCDRLTVDGRDLGARLIAVSPEGFAGAYQGLWYDEDGEEAIKHELEATVG